MTTTSSSSAPKIRIALVDDHPLFREGVRTVLATQPDFAFAGDAEDVEQGMKLADTARPDVLLLDIGLKGPNGMVLARELRARHPEIRIVVLSMNDTPNYVRNAIQSGARGYVVKHAPPTELVAAIRVVAAGGRFYPAGHEAALTSVHDESPAAVLTPRELAVAHFIASGKRNGEIAQALRISERTVETHRASIYWKLRVDSAIAIRERLAAWGE